MLKIAKPIVLFWLFSKCSNLNAPIMQTADQIKIENLGLCSSGHYFGCIFVWESSPVLGLSGTLYLWEMKSFLANGDSPNKPINFSENENFFRHSINIKELFLLIHGT